MNPPAVRASVAHSFTQVNDRGKGVTAGLRSGNEDELTRPYRHGQEESREKD